MTYCSHCGLIIETYDCPVCGFKNYRPEKPGESVPKEKPKEPRGHKNCPKNSSHLLAGGIGSMVMAAGAMILGILPLYNAMNDSWGQFDSEGIYILFLLGTVLFMIGSCVLIAGLYGLFRHYGGYQGLVALIFALISPAILFIFTFLAIESESYSYGYYSHYSSYQYYSIGPELWIGHIFVGIMFILVGMTWRSINFNIGFEQPNLSVGSMFILSGFLFLVFFGLTGIPWIMISVAAMAGGVLFMLGRAGTDSIPAGRPKSRHFYTPPVTDLPPIKY